MLDEAFVAKSFNLTTETNQEFSGVSIDSKQVQKGHLFFALPGSKRDGHNYLHDAISRGATGIVCTDYPKAFCHSVAVFKVPNTLLALNILAKKWRQKLSIPILAIGGSNGKTTTKEILTSLMSKKFKVGKTINSENGVIGLPKTILNISPSDQFAIVEVGIDNLGLMSKHMRMLQPTHGILTTIGEEHLSGLKTIKKVAE